MHIYIDETGDTGFKLDRGSSYLFGISLVIFHDPKEIEKTVRAIKKLEKRIHFPANAEWKFTKTKSIWRKEFLRTIANFNFDIRTVVMVKNKICAFGAKGFKESGVQGFE